MKTTQSPFAVMLDPGPALAAAARLRSHLPPYQYRLQDKPEEEADIVLLEQEVEKAK